MVNFEENSFFKVPEGVQHFPGGSNFFPKGSNCFYPIETHITQGRRRIFKSGPAVEAVECRRHMRGGSTIGGLLPLSLGGFGGPPPIFFFEF